MQPTSLHVRAAAALTLTAFCGFVAERLNGPSEVRASEQSKEAAVVAPGFVISEAEVEELAKAKLIRLRAWEYAIKKEVLEEQISMLLLEREAASRGITVEELTRLEIESKIHPMTEERARRDYHSSKVYFEDGTSKRLDELKTEEEAIPEIQQQDRDSWIQRFRQDFVAKLKVKFGTKILLEPPRVPVDPSWGPAKGPADAPVTIVEFSNFQYPFGSLKELEKKFPGKLRIVYRHFPLPAHKEAFKAAEAAECANEQGKFWEMHDTLYDTRHGRISSERGPALRPVELKRYAAELGLDTRRFDECLDSGRYAPEWQKGLADGRRYGVWSIPTFFVNGRLRWEGTPIVSLETMIEEELAKALPSGK